jgi:hypothetical protein
MREGERELWRDRYPDRVTCIRCLEVQDQIELDRLLWCEACRAKARRRASRWGWGVGAVLAGALALWIFVEVEPTRLMGGWIATIVAAFWIGSRIGSEVAYGIDRYRNQRAVEAEPPRAT